MDSLILSCYIIANISSYMGLQRCKETRDNLSDFMGTRRFILWTYCVYRLSGYERKSLTAKQTATTTINEKGDPR